MWNARTYGRGRFESIRSQLSPAEVETLRRIVADQGKKSWNYSLMISLMAFLLSLSTSLLAIYQNYQKDVHDQLAELATAVRTVQELNLRILEAQDKYGGTPNIDRATGVIFNLIYNTTMVAADLIERVGTHATTAVVTPISQGVHQYGQYARAETLAKIGLRSAKTYQDEVSALRWLGRMKYLEGTVSSREEGAQPFGRALAFEEKYGPIRSLGGAEHQKAGVYLEWASALATSDCEGARKLFGLGVDMLNAAPKTFDVDRLRVSAQARKTSGLAPGCFLAPEIQITR